MSLAVHGSFIGLVGSELLRVVYSDESGTGMKRSQLRLLARFY